MYDKKISNLLDRIVEYIKTQNIIYDTPNRDGRINSSINEGQIIDKLVDFFQHDAYLLSNKFEIKLPNARDWYDFGVVQKGDDDFFVPVNIKVTALSTDNLNCKLGIYFALTGLLPVGLSNEIVWNEFFKQLNDNINTRQDRDYYFLIANKKDNTDCFWNSLKSLQNLVANGNNLPFQANWAKNRDKVNRTHSEAGYFILNCFKESVYKRAEIRDSFQQYIEPHLAKYESNIKK